MTLIEIINGVANLGILVVIAGFFLHDHYVSSKKMAALMESNNQILASNTAMLKELQKANENTAKSLEIIQQNQDNYIGMTERIEKKIDCIKEKADIIKKERI